ncbi:Coiled-coil domain-containing protein 50 N-terminal [Trinorchestia longiramus]|nr:Coiled-coil domain-containing protein 50 N-terminal [Trinorchestia longiramus]
MADYRLNSMSSDDQDENNFPRRGLVTDVCREWTMHEDQALAYKLQNEEYDQHLGHNKSRNALLRHDTPHARQEQVKVDEEAARQHQRTLEELDRQEAADAALAANVAARLEEEERQRQQEIEKRDEELAKKLATEERTRIKEKKELRQVEREAAYLGINTGRDNVALLAAHTDSAETETAAASAAAARRNRRSGRGSRPPPLDLADLNDLSDFCLQPSHDMDEEEARRFQEEQDAVSLLLDPYYLTLTTIPLLLDPYYYTLTA